MRTPLLLYALALGVRLVVLAMFPDPAYTDSYYYVDVARALAAGRGFEVDFIWIFADVGGSIPAEPVLPIPSNAHWMPLASLVQVPFIAVMGPTPIASALPFALIGATAAPLAWAIGRDAGASPLVSVGAGFLVAVPLLTLPFMVQPDNFGLFQPLAAAAMWLGARALRSGRPRARNAAEFALAGLLVGLATLSRNDGVLLAAALGLALLWDRTRTRHALPAWAGLAALGAFIAVMAPWWLRQVETFGQLSPSTATGKVLLIRSIEEWNSITTPATLDHFLGQGAGPLIASRVDGLESAVRIFAVIVCGVVLAPFLVVGAWLRRRSEAFGPFFAYAALLFAFSALVSAVHVSGGTFIHSAVALAPHGYVLALEGVVAVTLWLAARRPRWDASRARVAAVGTAVVVGGVISALGVATVHQGWSETRAARERVAATLDELDPDGSDRLMSIEAAGYRYYTARGGVVLVNDPLETIHEVAAAYDIRWLVLENDGGVPAVGPLVAGARPSWVGRPVYESDGPFVVRVFPVCLAPADARCGVAS